MNELLYAGKPTRGARELFEFVQGMKSRDMRTNSIFTLPVLDTLCSEGKAWISIGEEAAVILCPDTENIVRLYYYAKNPSALHEVVSLLSETAERVVCDIVGKGEQAEALSHELQEAGFQFYAKFQRMVCTNIQTDDSLDLSHVEFARPEDAPEILEIVHQEFDPLTARIPCLEVLTKRIDEGEVFVVRRDGRIAGFTTFDSNRKRVALLDYVIVRPEYREEKIAKKILWHKWKHHNQSQYYILWINVLCTGPIRYHEKNGFQIDGMYDYILTL